MQTPTRQSGDAWELDDLDREIISALQSDGRRSYSEIARGLGISESSVRYRVQRLRKASILQVVGIADPLRIGFDIMALIGVKVGRGHLNDVCRAVAQFPESSYVAVTAGAFDLFVEVICRNTAHFSEVLTQRLQTTEGVLETQSFLVLEIHKMAYGWGVGEPREHALARGDEDIE
jgi:Lrp/AsnC family transcriptional regulator, regulator for asnA, asnC and gidA